MKAESSVERFKRCQQNASASEDRDQLFRLIELAQEMGGPLNVVHGRMEYLLGRKLDRETRRSLTAILTQAKQLIALRQQLINEARMGMGHAVALPPNGHASSD